MPRALLFGDTHVPYADWQAIGVVTNLVKAARPDLIVHMGDLIDCNTLSDKFPSDPRRRNQIQEDIYESVHVLKTVEWAAKKTTQLVYLLGNHEDRLRRSIWTMSYPARVMAELDIFAEYVSWPEILSYAGLSDRWEIHDYHDGQPVNEYIPHILLKHGSLVRKWSGGSAAAEWQKYGRSGASGHTHRLASFFHRDYNGSHQWIETGCTCLMNTGYGGDHDWQQGAVIIDYDDEWYTVELVYIQDGRARWRGKTLDA